MEITCIAGNLFTIAYENDTIGKFSKFGVRAYISYDKLLKWTSEKLPKPLLNKFSSMPHATRYFGRNLRLLWKTPLISARWSHPLTHKSNNYKVINKHWWPTDVSLSVENAFLWLSHVAVLFPWISFHIRHTLSQILSVFYTCIPNVLLSAVRQAVAHLSVWHPRLGLPFVYGLVRVS